MKKAIYWILAIGAFAVLGGAAVWMGGLNQDEGWYLYAANLVAEGKMPYRDFFYTQGPLLPIVYSAFTWVWGAFGVLGARVFTLGLGVAGIVFAAALARRLAPEGAKGDAALYAVLLLGANLYHIYYVTIPKTYALAGLFIIMGFYLASFLVRGQRKIPGALFGLCSGLCFAFAAGTRISTGAILCVVGMWLLLSKRWRDLVFFSLGGFIGLALVYGPFMLDHAALKGLLAAQSYHAARSGFDPVWTVGSVSRLVRWYLPVFIALGLGVVKSRGKMQPCVAILLWSFLAVFTIQMLAPFPYEDYQVPIMGVLAVFASVMFAGGENENRGEGALNLSRLLIMGLAFACSFGSPLLEKWAVNGQDRFWSIKKDKYELPQLRDVAKRIEELDPGGKEIFTQDIYIAIETGRKVPAGMEMGPYAVLSDDDYERLAREAKAPVAALSGYSFAVDMPSGRERPVAKQMKCWELLKANYKLVENEAYFGQNSTPLLILKRK